MRHNKQAATLLFSFDIWSSALSAKQRACIWVTFWGVKGHKCSAGHVLNDKFPNGKQLNAGGKEWEVRIKQ